VPRGHNADLQQGFRACAVTAKTLNIDHRDPHGNGPFCRLLVDDTALTRPGVYAWATDGNVVTSEWPVSCARLCMERVWIRAYNAYTYISASKVVQINSPRVRVNGPLLNRAIVAGATVMWWWLETATAIRQCAACPECSLTSEHRDPTT
jgi:hypothetical protein